MENPNNNKGNEITTEVQASEQVQRTKHLVKMMAYEMATEFAFMIALPILFFVYAGKWLDDKYHTKAFIIIGFFVALALSTFMIGKRINIIRKKLKTIK